jgi:photoactive yellow protein
MWSERVPGVINTQEIERRLEQAQQEYTRLSAEISELVSALAALRGEEVSGVEITERFRRAVSTDVEGRFGVGLPPGEPTTGPLIPPMPMSVAALPTMPEQHAAFDAGLVNQLTPEELNRLPYGVIVVDGRGKIIHYNDTESRLVGLPREKVIGRHFFGDVAPCARVKEFEGRFRTLVNGQSRLGVETFEFVFHFAKGAQRVLIMLSPGRIRGQYNISLMRR